MFTVYRLVKKKKKSVYEYNPEMDHKKARILIAFLLIRFMVSTNITTNLHIPK